MIRVLQIGDSLKRRSGITAFLMNYNSVMDSSRVVFDYLIIDVEECIREKIKNFGGNIYYMPKLNLLNALELVTEIKKFFKEHNYEIVHSHFYQIIPIVKAIACQNGTKHYISHSHNTKYADSKIRTFRNCLMSLPVRLMSDHFCACSVAAGNFLFGSKILKMRKKELFVVPNAINYKKFYFNYQMRCEIRAKYSIDKKKVYGNIARFKPQKNQLFLLDVFCKIHQFDRDSVLMLIGEGELKGNLIEKARRLGILDNVVMVDTTDHPQDFYNAFDCYIFPSIYEGFGLTLLEAEVNGLPCVCADTIPEEPIISQNVEILSLEKNADKWASVCIDMLKKGRSNETLSHKYDLTTSALKLMNYYEELYNA